MTALKVMTIVGTRPELIKLSETIKLCDRHFEHILVHTGQNYDFALNRIFFDELRLREPDYNLGVAGGDLGETMGRVISGSYELMARLKPDALLVLGDTNSCLSAISAKRLKIPVFHLEAGNRCFDENLPEEINRRIVDHISDVNLCYSEHARRYLNREGVAPERTFVVGSPMAEVLTANLAGIEGSAVLETLSLEPGEFILLSAHREENIDIEKNFFSLMNAINAMAEKYAMPVIYSVHPRSGKTIQRRGFVFHPLVRNLEPFGFHDYCRLQKSAFCVVSDSGTLPEEAGFFKFPAVSIRTSTERPEALEKGSFIIAGIEADGLVRAVDLAVRMAGDGFAALPVPDYVEAGTSAKVVRMIQSYCGIVDRMVWRKD